jgi:hypothetical protein
MNQFQNSVLSYGPVVGISFKYGNLVIYVLGERPIWSSDTWQHSGSHCWDPNIIYTLAHRHQQLIPIIPPQLGFQEH